MLGANKVLLVYIFIAYYFVHSADAVGKLEKVHVSEGADG